MAWEADRDMSPGPSPHSDPSPPEPSPPNPEPSPPNPGRLADNSEIVRVIGQAVDVAIAAVAAKQNGNITRRQLLALGLDDDAISYRVRIGRLYRVFRGVYAAGRRAVTPHERASAAVLACGPGAALSHGCIRLQLADLARETRPDLKILFITGYAESVAIADGFLQPGMEMITKPFDLDHLSRRIRAMVSG